MATTALATQVLSVNGSAADPTGTASTSGAGNGLVIAAPAGEQTLLRVVGTNAGNAIVKAGTSPGAISKGQGDLTVAVGSGATVWIGPFESARFGQTDGSILLETSAAMTVTAFRVNRH